MNRYPFKQIKSDMDLLFMHSYGREFPQGFFTGYEYEDGPFRIERTYKGYFAYWRDSPVDLDAVNMGSPFANWLLEKVVYCEDLFQARFGRATTYYADGRIVHSDGRVTYA